VREQHIDTDLHAIVLTDVSTGSPVDLGDLPGVQVLTLIRHRF
jgi:hypothetical protein